MIPPSYNRAACRNLREDEREIFFPEANLASVMDAKRMCLSCDIRQECLDYAMAVEQGKGRSDRFGIWGGATPAQRHKMECGKPVTLFRTCAYTECGKEFPVGSHMTARCCSQKCGELYRYAKRKAAA